LISLFGFLIGLEFDSKHPGYSHMVHLLPEALQDLMTARNLNLFLLAVRMTSAGAARREAILDVIGMEVNPKVVKSFGVGKILQLLRKVVRETWKYLVRCGGIVRTRPRW
jgi:hypothetical protein